MTLRLSNPYAGCGTGRGAWIRGSIHGHSSEHSGCSSVPLADGIARYHAAGAGFVAVTDHDHVSDLESARARYPRIAFLEGFEHSMAENVLFVGERVPPLYQLAMNDALAAADGLLTVICHPRPRAADDYWTVNRILALSPCPIGIEVYNGHYRPDRCRGRTTIRCTRRPGTRCSRAASGSGATLMTISTIPPTSAGRGTWPG